MPPSKLKSGHTSPFEGMPSTGWRPTRKRPAMNREMTAAPPGSDDPRDTLDQKELPANGVAPNGSATSRKI